MNLEHTALLLREQSDQGPYCLQYRLPKNISRQEEQTTKDLTGGLRVKVSIFTSRQVDKPRGLLRLGYDRILVTQF